MHPNLEYKSNMKIFIFILNADYPNLFQCLLKLPFKKLPNLC